MKIEQTPAAAASSPPVHSRRVGTFTMGVCLVFCGILILLTLFAPSLDLSFYIKLCPLVLVLLGAEIIWFSVRRPDEKLRYDFLSMILCFLVICGSFFLALVPSLVRFYGPEGEAACYRLSGELDQACYQLLKDDPRICDCSGFVYLSSLETDLSVPLSELSSDSYQTLDIDLAGGYTDAEAFAKDAYDIWQILKESDLNLSEVSFYWNSQQDTSPSQMSLTIRSAFSQNASADQLTRMVVVEQPVDTIVTDDTQELFEAAAS